MSPSRDSKAHLAAVIILAPILLPHVAPQALGAILVALALRQLGRQADPGGIAGHAAALGGTRVVDAHVGGPFAQARLHREAATGLVSVAKGARTRTGLVGNAEGICRAVGQRASSAGDGWVRVVVLLLRGCEAGEGRGCDGKDEHCGLQGWRLWQRVALICDALGECGCWFSWCWRCRVSLFPPVLVSIDDGPAG